MSLNKMDDRLFKWGQSNRYAFSTDPSAFKIKDNVYEWHAGKNTCVIEIPAIWFSTKNKNALVLGMASISESRAEKSRLQTNNPIIITPQSTYIEFLTVADKISFKAYAEVILGDTTVWSGSSNRGTFVVDGIRTLLGVYDSVKQTNLLPVGWDGWYNLK